MTNPRPHPVGPAWAAGIVVAFLWASAFPAIRIAAPALGVIGLSVSRLVIASLVLVVIGVLTKKVRLPRWTDVPWIVACGISGMAGYFLLLNWGELYVPAGTASMIVSASPIVSIAIAAIALREPLSKPAIVGSVVAVLGVIIVSVARAGIAFSSAVWIVIAAAILLGIYHPLTRPLLKRYSGLEVATYATVSAAIMTLPLFPLAWSQLSTASHMTWIAAVYLGVFPSAIGYALWGFSLSRLTVATTTSFLYLVPVIAVAIAYFYLDEVPLAVELLGGAVVLLGVVILHARRARPKQTFTDTNLTHDPSALREVGR